MKDRIAADAGVQKCPTGIAGLDQITAGDLPHVLIWNGAAEKLYGYGPSDIEGRRH